MLAPLDHPAGKYQPSNTAAATTFSITPSQISQQIDTPSSSAQLLSPAVEYSILPVDDNNDQQEDQPLSRHTGRTTVPPPENHTLPSVQSQTQPQLQQNGYSIPESMGHESIGDFAYINTFPEYGATNNSYEMQQQPYPDSFQQMQHVQHLNRAFSPQSSIPHQQQQQQQQPQQQYQHQQQCLYNQQQPRQQYQQQRQHSEPSVQLYPEPELVDTRVNEINAAAAMQTATAGRSLSYLSSASSSSPPSKPTRRLGRKGIFWVGGAVVITLIGAVIALVVLKKSGDSNNDSASSNGDTNNENSRPYSTYSAQLPPPTPLPQPTSFPGGGGGGRGGGGGGSEGPEVQPPRLPPFPAKGKPCSTFFCSDYNWAYRKVCIQDGAYKTCAERCSRGKGGVDVLCEMECESVNFCFLQGRINVDTCLERCRDLSNGY